MNDLTRGERVRLRDDRALDRAFILYSKAPEAVEGGLPERFVERFAMSGDAAVMSEKVLAAEALGRMPETATLRQIGEELALLAALRESAAEADAGRVVSHPEVLRRATAWTLKSSG